jgi:glycosyltransferase involved in cell wall biosynthesis
MVDRSLDVELSVIVPVGARQSNPAELYNDYKTGLEALQDNYEIIFVLDGPREDFATGLRALLDGGERFTVISLSRPFGEATAIMAGFEHASGQTIVTMPAYHQIEGVEIGKLVKGLETADLVVGHRWPRAGGAFERIRRKTFHSLLSWVMRLQLRDVGCTARAMDRRVLEEISLYGDQHRYLPVLADRQGFRVLEVNVRQSPKDRFEGNYQPREYTRVLLDLFTVFFLVRFTKKPLRFFGMVGVTTFAFGALAVTWVVIEKLFFGQALGDRPALLLASLLVVLGLQLLALGLLGELMIFTHAKGLKDYQVERVIQFGSSTSSSTKLQVRG